MNSKTRSFWSLIVVQFAGAFNDNLLKFIIQFLIVDWIADPARRNALVNVAGAVFVLPFLIFSMVAGRVADRTSKSTVIKWVQVWQLLVVAVASGAILAKSIPAMLLCLFVLSMQATFFSPAKYGILPELMGEQELSNANGILNMATFAAILAGTIVATVFSRHLTLVAGLLIGLSLLALVVSWAMKPLPAAKPEEPLRWNPLSDLMENWKLIKQDRALKLGIIATNYFWFMGSILLLNVVLYAREMLKVGPEKTGVLFACAAIGVGMGSLLAGKLSKGKVEVGLVPIGSLGMSIFAIDLMWAHHSIYRTGFDLFMLGLSGGLYEIPLIALIQWRSAPAERGRVLATQNFLSFVAILSANVVLWFLGSKLLLDPAEVLFALGIASFIGTVFVYSFVPAAVWRLILYLITNAIYRIKILHGDRLPAKGPALIIANHLSLADGFLLGSSIPRMARFLIWKPYYERRPWHWLLKTLKAIPISETDPPKEVMRSLLEARKALEEGNVVCIFAEGQVSRTGNLLEFKRGFEVIVKGFDVPVIPVHLDRVWGSIFSFEHGKVIFKKPRRIPYPVTVTFGEPLKQPMTPASARQAVLDLSAEAFQHRLSECGSLAIEFLKTACKQPSVMAVADSSGTQFSFGKLAAASHELARVMEKDLTSAINVGVLLPSSVGGALTNVALSLLGRIPVNLNYTAGAAAIESAIKRAQIDCILTSRKLLEKTKLPATPNMLFVEDFLPRLNKLTIVLNRVALSLLPRAFNLKRLSRRAASSIDETATIMFSSGSTGVPKGVVLSHANILSNLKGLQQVFDVGPRDRILGILPFFHSFGFTATIWFPLVAGFGAVYHTNPLDSKSIGDLAAKFKATLLLATPTFLLAYVRKIPAEQFQSLRFVVTGAERLQDSIAKAFEEKFKRPTLEGYGCTELSPVATANVPDISMGEIQQVGHKSGKVGHPIPGVSVKVVDQETFAPVPQGQQGLLLVKGPNVMQGYLGDPEKTAEVIKDGWYVTGDLALIDNDGFVQILDRLSRFSKIGGEMVPHVMLEERLHDLSRQTEPTFVVTSAPDAKRGEQLVVFYAGFEGSIEEVHKKLGETDLPKLWIPARENFFSLEAIPYLGTGKLDLAALRKLAQDKTKSI